MVTTSAQLQIDFPVIQAQVASVCRLPRWPCCNGKISLSLCVSVAGRMIAALLVAAAASGCASGRPWINSPLPSAELEMALSDPGLPLYDADAASMLVGVTLSGGGARAAAFGYGVLQELKATRFRWNGQTTTMLDRVSLIGGVSGGSITAAYYAAFGDEIFTRFEPDYLLQDFQNSLIGQMLNPLNLHAMTSPWYGRGNVLADRLDKLFRGATFADVADRRKNLRLLITATELTTGSPFEFTPQQFALICSDLANVPLSFAVAASSSVPVVFSPLTLKNYANHCDVPEMPPQLLRASADAPYQAHMLQRQAHGYQDVEQRPFIHLVDGGLTDNLGVRRMLDATAAQGGLAASLNQLPTGSIQKIVLVVVNSERDTAERIDRSSTVPSIAQVADALLFGAGARATQETVAIMDATVRRWTAEIKRAEHGGNNPFAADAQIYGIHVSLRDVPDASERRASLQVPTALSISSADVRRLQTMGRLVLRESVPFQALLKTLDVQSSRTLENPDGPHKSGE